MNNNQFNKSMQTIKNYVDEKIPTKTSQLTNDSNFISSIPEEYITEQELNSTIQDYTGGKKQVYLTQAEYDLLSESAKNDESKVYNITDATEQVIPTDLTINDNNLLQLKDANGNTIGTGVTVSTTSNEVILTSPSGYKFKLIVNDEGQLSTEEIVIYGNIIASVSELSVNEGESNTFTISLSQAPTRPQTITIVSDNTDVTINPSSINISDTNPHTITVTAAEDDDFDNDTAILTLSSPNVPNVTVNVTVIDNDTEPIPVSENIFPYANIPNEVTGSGVTVTKTDKKLSIVANGASQGASLNTNSGQIFIANIYDVNDSILTELGDTVLSNEPGTYVLSYEYDKGDSNFTASYLVYDDTVKNIEHSTSNGLNIIRQSCNAISKLNGLILKLTHWGGDSSTAYFDNIKLIKLDTNEVFLGCANILNCYGDKCKDTLDGIKFIFSGTSYSSAKINYTLEPSANYTIDITMNSNISSADSTVNYLNINTNGEFWNQFSKTCPVNELSGGLETKTIQFTTPESLGKEAGIYLGTPINTVTGEIEFLKLVIIKN